MADIDLSCFEYGARDCPPALARSDAWAARMYANPDECGAVASEIEAALAIFKPLPMPCADTSERWLWQATIHCLNYAMRSLNDAGRRRGLGLPWGLGAGRSRLDAIECFKRAIPPT